MFKECLCLTFRWFICYIESLWHVWIRRDQQNRALI